MNDSIIMNIFANDNDDDDVNYNNDILFHPDEKEESQVSSLQTTTTESTEKNNNYSDDDGWREITLNNNNNSNNNNMKTGKSSSTIEAEEESNYSIISNIINDIIDDIIINEVKRSGNANDNDQNNNKRKTDIYDDDNNDGGGCDGGDNNSHDDGGGGGGVIDVDGSGCDSRNKKMKKDATQEEEEQHQQLLQYKFLQQQHHQQQQQRHDDKDNADERVSKSNVVVTSKNNTTNSSSNHPNTLHSPSHLVTPKVMTQLRLGLLQNPKLSLSLIPTNVMTKIFSYLKLPSLVICRQVSRSFQQYFHYELIDRMKPDSFGFGGGDRGGGDESGSSRSYGSRSYDKHNKSSNDGFKQVEDTASTTTTTTVPNNKNKKKTTTYKSNNALLTHKYHLWLTNGIRYQIKYELRLVVKCEKNATSSTCWTKQYATRNAFIQTAVKKYCNPIGFLESEEAKTFDYRYVGDDGDDEDETGDMKAMEELDYFDKVDFTDFINNNEDLLLEMDDDGEGEACPYKHYWQVHLDTYDKMLYEVPERKVNDIFNTCSKDDFDRDCCIVSGYNYTKEEECKDDISKTKGLKTNLSDGNIDNEDLKAFKHCLIYMVSFMTKSKKTTPPPSYHHHNDPNSHLKLSLSCLDCINNNPTIKISHGRVTYEQNIPKHMKRGGIDYYQFEIPIDSSTTTTAAAGAASQTASSSTAAVNNNTNNDNDMIKMELIITRSCIKEH